LTVTPSYFNGTEHKNTLVLKQGWEEDLVKEIEGKQLTTCVQTLDNLAYVVYSSGTTGKPKGEASST
jgi:acyl-coenzyme A synthetase/AMP-(fatty) acid ligase